MYCIYCGKELDDKAVFCLQCGQPTGNGIIPTPPAPTDTMTITPDPTETAPFTPTPTDATAFTPVPTDVTAFTPAQPQSPEQAPARGGKPFNGWGLAGFILGMASALIGMLSFFLVVLCSAVDPEGWLSLLPSCALFFTLFGAIFGIVFSAVGLGLRKRYAHGMGFAITGLIISIIYFLALILLYAVSVLIVLLELAGSGGIAF